jgi:hypothetical protein
MLEACASDPGSRAEPVGATREAFSGTASVQYVSWIGTSPQVGTDKNLRNLDGTSTLLAVAAGFWAPGDGGGGVFCWDSTSTTGDDGGTIIVPSNPTGRWMRIYSGPINVAWFGAVADGVDHKGDGTYDTSFINAAASVAAGLGGTLLLSAGKTFSITGTVAFNCHVEGAGAKLLTAGAMNSGSPACTAVLVGTSTAKLAFARMYLPDVSDMSNPSGTAWVGTANGGPQRVGVECRNLVDCEIHFGTIAYFTIGAYITSDNGTWGNLINKYYIKALIDNAVNLQLQPLGTHGWVNENTFFGGDFEIICTGTPPRAGTRMILLSNAAWGCNGNLFVKPCVEGDWPEYHIECQGADNVWMHARFETGSVSPKVYFNGSAATRNVVQDGYFSGLIVVSTNGGASGNSVISPQHQLVEGVGNSTGFGTLALSNEYGGGVPVIAVMPAGGFIAANNPSSYYVQIQEGASYYKDTTDTNPRVQISHTDSSLWFGIGGTCPCSSKVGINVSSGFMEVYGIYGTSIGGSYTGGLTYGLGFYAAPPIAQPTRVGQLTSGAGTAGTSVSDVGSSFNQTTLNNNFASIVAKLNAIEARISQAAGGLGLTA